MPQLTKAWLQDLQSKIDSVQLVQQYVSLEKSGKGYKGKCPFHQDDTPSFFVYPDNHSFHCFGCGEHGDLIGFLTLQRNLDFMEAVKELAQLAGVAIPHMLTSQVVDEQARKNMKLYDALEAASKLFQKALQQNTEAKNYLAKRKIEPKIAKQYGLGYAPNSFDYLKGTLADIDEKVLVECGLLSAKTNTNGKTFDMFRNRLMFPISDFHGRVVGFGGRVLSGGKPKYLNSPQTPLFHKRELLYGFHEIRSARVKIDSVIVVEGYMDVITLAQHGFQNAVAPLGTALTDGQIQRLKRLSKQIVLFFDGDDAGQTAAWRALTSCYGQLEQGQVLRVVRLPKSHDPDSYLSKFGGEKLKELIAQAPLSSKYFFETLQNRYDLESPESKMGLEEEARPIIDHIPYEPFRALMSQELSRLTGVNPDVVKKSRRKEKSYSTTASAKQSGNNARSPSKGGLTAGERRILRQLIFDMEFVSLISNSSMKRFTEFAEISLLFNVITRIRRNRLQDFAELIASYERESWEHGQLDILAKMGPPEIKGSAHYHAIHNAIEASLVRLQKIKHLQDRLKD